MRGRPRFSQIRQNIVELLYFLGPTTGYDVYRAYIKVFPSCTMRSIYYHLHKGAQTGEFQIQRVQSEKGSYSWGSLSEKIYYILGKKAQPKILKKVELSLQR